MWLLVHHVTEFHGNLSQMAWLFPFSTFLFNEAAKMCSLLLGAFLLSANNIILQIPLGLFIKSFINNTKNSKEKPLFSQ